MLRSIPRAAPSSSLRPSIRTAFRIPRSTLPTCTADVRQQQTRSVAAHAISNPTLAEIEKRWEGMPPQEQADLWMALRDRMKHDWHELTLQERKAGMSACTVRKMALSMCYAPPTPLRHKISPSLSSEDLCETALDISES